MFQLGDDVGQGTGPDPRTTVVYEEFQNQPLPTPQAIIAERTVSSAEGDQYQVLVEWEGRPREDSTWESWTTLIDLYNEQDLADKVISHGGGNDTSPHVRKLGSRMKSARVG